jgi:glucose-1-phosphate cytidylyltransferase
MEETDTRPKPMVEVGGYPVLWHILKHYSHFGFNEFAIALGYKGDFIKRWVREYSTLSGDMTIEIGTGQITLHDTHEVNWRIHLVETGLKTQTGGRIKRLAPWMGDETFMLTWGDGVSDVDLDRLLDFHRSHGKLATMTAVRPPARYGHLEFDGDRVMEFTEKPQTREGWINGAFFVLEPGIFDYIRGDDVMWEHEPLQQLAKAGELMAYRHHAFWQCMDTLREKHILETLWKSGDAPWKSWD